MVKNDNKKINFIIFHTKTFLECKNPIEILQIENFIFNFDDSTNIQDTIPMLSPNSCGKYFKLGSTTRRHSVIGCFGYENANPYFVAADTSEVGVGTNDDNDECCAICLDALTSTCAPQKNIATTECGHTFCLSCLLKNLHTSNLCPLCRAPIEKDVKKVLKPLSYSEGIQLLNHELNGLDIYNNVEHFVQNALEISNQPNTDGQNVQDVVDGVVNMVTNFGFNLLFDATLHTNGGEERHMDEEWIIQMYNDDSDDSDGSNSTINDYNNDSSSSSDSDDDEDEDENSDSTTVNGSFIAIRLPEIPESMLE